MTEILYIFGKKVRYCVIYISFIKFAQIIDLLMKICYTNRK